MQSILINMIKVLADLNSKYGYQQAKYYDSYAFFNGADVPVEQTF